jgi:hypothetical protein
MWPETDDPIRHDGLFDLGQGPEIFTFKTGRKSGWERNFPGKWKGDQDMRGRKND